MKLGSVSRVKDPNVITVVALPTKWSWSMAGRSAPDGVTSATAEEDAEGDHADAQDEVQPVVGHVDGHEVGRRRVVHHQPVQPQHEVDGPSADEVVAGVPGCPRQGEAGEAEEDVDDVVQDGDLEDP